MEEGGEADAKKEEEGEEEPEAAGVHEELADAQTRWALGELLVNKDVLRRVHCPGEARVQLHPVPPSRWGPMGGIVGNLDAVGPYADVRGREVGAAGEDAAHDGVVLEHAPAVVSRKGELLHR